MLWRDDVIPQETNPIPTSHVWVESCTTNQSHTPVGCFVPEVWQRADEGLLTSFRFSFCPPRGVLCRWKVIWLLGSHVQKREAHLNQQKELREDLRFHLWVKIRSESTLAATLIPETHSHSSDFLFSITVTVTPELKAVKFTFPWSQEHARKVHCNVIYDSIHTIQIISLVLLFKSSGREGRVRNKQYCEVSADTRPAACDTLNPPCGISISRRQTALVSHDPAQSDTLRALL